MRKAVASLALLLAATFLTGCSSFRGTPSPYRGSYNATLARVRLPSSDTIRWTALAEEDAVLIASFQLPPSAVWMACLEIAEQSWGILAVDGGPSHASSSVLFIAGELEFSGLEIRETAERWLAVSVEAETEGETRVYVTFVSPHTLEPVSVKKDPLVSGKDQASVAKRVAMRFLDRLKIELGEEPDLFKFTKGDGVGRAVTERTRRGDPAPLAALPVLDVETRMRLERRAHFASALYRSNVGTLTVPELESVVLRLAEDLAAASGAPNPVRGVYIIHNKTLGIWILPNGELFLNSGILAGVKNLDELAFLVAHEIAHIQLGHSIPRDRTVLGASTSRILITSSLILGAAIATGFLPISEPDSASSIEETTFTTEEVLVGVATALGGFYLAERLGSHGSTPLAEAIVRRTTRQQEFEADSYAIELLWAAGYDYHAAQTFLEREGQQVFLSK